MNWDDDATDTLVALWRDKQTSTAIAKELGTTRNAVMGKIKRMGLIGKGSAPRPPPGRKFKALAETSSSASRETRHKPTLKPVEPAGSFNCTLVELTESSCRWPIGDPQDWNNFRYCGAQRHENKVYCLTHWRASWAKTSYQPYIPGKIAT